MKQVPTIAFIMSCILLFSGCSTATEQESVTQVDTVQTTPVEEIVTEESVQTVEPDTSDTTDTEDWLTYTNTEYGFSFKHPEDLPFDVRLENGYFYVYFSEVEGLGEYSPMAFQIDDLERLTWEDWFERNVDVNNVLTYTVSITDAGSRKFIPSGANSLEDLNGYAQIGSFIEDKENGRSIAFAYGQDKQATIEATAPYEHVLEDVVESLSFIKLDSSRSIIGTSDQVNGKAVMITNNEEENTNSVVLETGNETVVLAEGEVEYTDDYSNFDAVVHYNSVAFSPQGQYIFVKASAWESSGAIVYDGETGEELLSDNAVLTYEYTSDEQYLMMCGGGGISGRTYGRLYRMSDTAIVYDTEADPRSEGYNDVHCIIENDSKAVFTFADTYDEAKEGTVVIEYDF